MRLGWRAKIGQIRPATAIEGAEEWRSVAPEGVHFADARTIVPTVDTDGLKVMMEQVLQASRQLATAHPDLIVQCGAPGIFLNGEQGYETAVTSGIQKETGVPAITMMGAMVEALKAVGAQRIALCSTYPDEVNESLGRYLETFHIKTLAMRSVGFSNIYDPYESSLHGDDVSYRLARKVFAEAGNADTVLISCGTFRTFKMLPYLEQDCGVPVISSNQATLWRALRAVGLRDVIPNLGRLWSVA